MIVFVFKSYLKNFFFLFKIPVLQTNNGPSLTGLTTIAAHLVKQANKEYLLGSTAEEKAIVQQWLEYRVTRVDGNSNKDDIRILLKVLWLRFIGWDEWTINRRNLSCLRYSSWSYRPSFSSAPGQFDLLVPLPERTVPALPLQISAQMPLPQKRSGLPFSHTSAIPCSISFSFVIRHPVFFLHITYHKLTYHVLCILFILCPITGT